MEEPDDPGGGVPQVHHTVTISSINKPEPDNGMDTDHTDSSVTSDKNRKRVCPSRKICRHCNKKRRRNKNKNPDYILTENDCNCTNDSVNKVDIQPIPTTTINNSTTNMNSPSPPQPTDTFRKVYVNTDCSPFVVHVQRMQDAPNDGTSIHPISFGNFLKKKSFKNIINGSVKRIGRNRVTLSFSHLDDANKFLNDKTLTDNKYKAFIPSFSVMRMGIVKGVPAEWSLEEILLNVSVPLGTGKVIKARRLNYKTIVDGSAVWKPSQTVVLTFDGQVLPKRIFICYNALPVDLYIFPTIQCYNCCRYGHTKTQCRSKPCCYKCGQGHSGSTCDVEEDCVSCFLCTGHHFAISKQCPEFERQKNIKLSMAQSCLSYAEASKLHHPVSKPYADVLLSPPPHQINQSQIKQPNHQTNTPTSSYSYKKTVFLKPRDKPKYQKGYDKSAHNDLIKEYDMPSTSGNGTAIQKEKPNNNQPSISELILELIKLLSSSNIIPNNVADIISFISNIINVNNGQQQPHSAVELSQHKE
ncbi:uncharacterized protein [Choristoneura fumiferana]|uniref:uncharacterized protein n=1 Tax=Choristoneura fumiferana TaxID=7141 RepID=UPI003D15A8DD